jgi:ubiquinone biosynthesis protein UbiJ
MTTASQHMVRSVSPWSVVSQIGNDADEIIRLKNEELQMKNDIITENQRMIHKMQHDIAAILSENYNLKQEVARLSNKK